MALREHSTQTFGTPPPDVGARYHFDETPGETIARDSLGAVDGTLSGSASFVAGGVSGNTLSVTRSGNGFVNLGDHFAHMGEFSIVAWVKTAPGHALRDVILGRHVTGFDNGVIFGFDRHVNCYGANSRAFFYQGGTCGN